MRPNKSVLSFPSDIEDKMPQSASLPRLSGANFQMNGDGDMPGGGDGGSANADPADVHGRLSRIEGGVTTQQWAIGVVSASLLAAMAIIIAITLALWGSVTSLSGKVDALPGAIRQELQDLNGFLIDAIRAGRETAPAAGSPTVIVIPQGVLDPAEPELVPGPAPAD